MVGLLAAQTPETTEESRTAYNGYQVLSGISRPAKIEKRHITRNRTSYSCQICRKRKIKCDKIHPRCGACAKNGSECVYGLAESVEYNKPGVESANGSVSHILSSRQSEASTTTRRSSIRGNDSTATANSLQESQLAALEEQLVRLTSLVEGMRKDSLASGSKGAQTTVASNSMNGDASSLHNHESATHPNAAPLDASMAGLGLDHTLTYRSFFCQAVCEELDNLQHLLQDPFGGLAQNNNEDHVQEPHALTVDQYSRPLTFQSAVRGYNPQPSPNCRVCQQAAVEKSIFLLGPSSQQARTPQNIDLVRGLPSESQSNVLFRAWMASVFPVLPYTPLEMLVSKYRAFWEWKRQYDKAKDVIESMDVGSMPMINAIWYAGVLALSAKGLSMWFPGRKRAELAAHYHDQTVRYLAFLSFPSTVQLPLVGAAVLLEFLPAAEQEPLQSSSYLNMILRLVQGIGIHRESCLAGLASDDAERRRRLWAAIVRLDTGFSVASGLPPAIDDDTADTRPVTELKDGHIHPSQLVGRDKSQKTSPSDLKDAAVLDPQTGKRSIGPGYDLVAKAQLLIDNVMRKIVRLHTGPQKMTRELVFGINEMITEVEEQVKAIICSLPTAGVPELGFEPDNEATPLYDCHPMFATQIQDAELSNYTGGQPAGLPLALARYHRQKQSAFNKWACIVLSLMCDKLHCLAYAPFLKNARSKVWATNRHCALHHATSFLRKFVSLASDPVLEPFRWTWPAMFHPMHAAIIILVDVYERPFSIEAARNRSWIDKIFALADPASGIVGGPNGVSIQRPLHEGGVAVFDQFRGLRASAWRRAGLDPDVLWTEEDQMLVGVAKPLTEDQRIAQSLREGILFDRSSMSPHSLSDSNGSSNNKSSPESSSSLSSNTTANTRTTIRSPAGSEARKSFTSVNSGTRNSLERAHVLDYALSEHAEPVLASNKPTGYRFVKIEGQNKMPFPMTAKLRQRCAKAEKAHNDAAALRGATNGEATNASASTITLASDGTTEEILLQDIVSKIRQFAGKQDNHSDGKGNNGETAVRKQDVMPVHKYDSNESVNTSAGHFFDPQSLMYSNSNSQARAQEQEQQQQQIIQTPLVDPPISPLHEQLASAPPPPPPPPPPLDHNIYYSQQQQQQQHEHLPFQHHFPTLPHPAEMEGNNNNNNINNNNINNDNYYANPGQEGPDYFDWDRWDAVFSQYGNFTDFMEDVQWEGLAEA